MSANRAATQLAVACGLFALSCVAATWHGEGKVTREVKRARASSIGFSDDIPGISSEEEKMGFVARQAALAAGSIMLEGSGSLDMQSDVENKSGSRDIVTWVDKESQRLITEAILEHFPGHKFLGEEDVPPGREASQQAIEAMKNEPHLWVVDPVDGTTNYAHGMPMAVVSIAYASFGVIKFGLIYDPFRGEAFMAWQGRGAYLNGRKLRCCPAVRLDTSVICTGSPPALDAMGACLRGMEVLSPVVRSMRVLGSACLHLAWVACGRISGFFEPDLNAWDIAAGSLIVQEAGGRVTDVWGEDIKLTTRNVVASNGKFHSELLHNLVGAKMWI